MDIMRFINKCFQKILPPMLVKHYIDPLFIRSKQMPYDAKQFFEEKHRKRISDEFSDRMTINPHYKLTYSRYHYNAVENSIIEYWAREPFCERPSVLDVGPGAGHWIDFYLDVFRAARVVGIDISEPCVSALRSKYRDVSKVDIRQVDITSPDFDISEKFDVINAIGVIFHVVEDDLWQHAIRNLSRHLKAQGVIITGGEFGHITQNVQFRLKPSKALAGGRVEEAAFVTKRIRSLGAWKKCVAEAGLRVKGFVKTKRLKGVRVPENNILVLSR